MSIHTDRCLVPPHPELRERMRRELERLRAGADPIVGRALGFEAPNRMGFNDGLIIPGTYFPDATPAAVVRRAAAERAPLRGPVRVIVVLVDFPDQPMVETRQHFQDLFFTAGTPPHGSVKDYYREVTNGLLDVVGEVVGPYRLPHPMSYYANNQSGTGNTEPNARTMAQDAVRLADPRVDFKPYDNDGNGFVDAFIVLHAGPGAEVTGSGQHIWSHKWVLPAEYAADGTHVYGYLTVPEDSKIGVCCHELGHLLFGWPDLYDTDGSSEGLGNWCLMAGGSWNGGGDRPAHPSAWCKASQGWVTVVNQAKDGEVKITDVKRDHIIYRLWTNSTISPEYFLLENRERQNFDTDLPGEGLLVYHIDDGIQTNSNEVHPKVKLMEADGERQLEQGLNRGDLGDVFPGNTKNRTFTKVSQPSSKTYSGRDSYVSITDISDAAASMTAHVTTHRVKR
jgi:immune inhibitor A